jgi:hypothetical protein
MTAEPPTYDLRLHRKAIKDILSKAPDGMDKDELVKLAGEKGIAGEDFQKAFESLISTGRVYYDKSGKVRYVRTE